MHPLVRGESRRRTQTPDPPRRRRAPSASVSVPPTRHIQALLDSITHFTAATPTAQPLLLALSTTLFATFFFLIPRPSLTSIRLIIRTRAFPLLAFLHTYYLLATFLAVQLIGPIRALIALGAHPTLAKILGGFGVYRRTKLLPYAILFVLAVSFLVYDATGAQPGLGVRDRVLRTPAGRAVHHRIQTISEKIKVKSKKLYNKQFVGRKRQKQNPPSVANPDLGKLHPPVPPKPPRKGKKKKPANNSVVEEKPKGKKKEEAASRRRLLSIANGEEVVAKERNHSKTSKKRKPPVANVTKSNVAVNATREKKLPVVNPVVVQPEESRHAGTADLSRPGASRLSAILGVFLALSAALSGQAATELRDKLIGEHGEWSALCTSLFLSCSFFIFILVLPYYIVAYNKGLRLTMDLFPDMILRTLLLSSCALIIPTLLQVHRYGLFRRSRSSRTAKGSSPAGLSALLAPLFGADARFPTTTSLYAVLLLTWAGVRLLSFPTNLGKVALGSYASAFLFVLVSVLLSRPEPRARRGRVFSSGDVSAYLTKGSVGEIRSFSVSVRDSLIISIRGIKDLVIHARSNKASGQVLNFLILQSGMATVELIYATATKSTGLFSISADNFFCSVALAIGLVAIRISTRKSSSRFTYGFSRIESLCGFANGIILVYIGVLVLLEAVERLDEDAEVAIGRAFFVCMIGVVGNLLGLYFFPPESRRENHNVQGIYLHIWANTLAFASMAISTAIITANPDWKNADPIISATVGAGMIAFSIPLLIRSSRLLLLRVPKEKEAALVSATARLNQIAGVVKVSALRVWSLTPNSLVASVRLKVSTRHEGSDAEVLLRARSVFAMLGIAANQCTIQITRVESATPQSVVYLPARSSSIVRDTGINIELLPSGSKSRIEAGHSSSSDPLLTL